MFCLLTIRRAGNVLRYNNSRLFPKANFCHNANIHNIKSPRSPGILKIKCLGFVPTRTYFKIFRKPPIAKLKIKDNISDEYNLIYRNTMDRYILFAQLFSTVAVIIVALGAAIQYDKNRSYNYELRFYEWSSDVRPTDNEIYYYVAALFAFAIMLQLLISRMPVRIYNLPVQRKYVLVFHGNYPFSIKKMECTIGDVVPRPEYGVLPWRNSRYWMKNEHKLILLEEFFRRPADLHIMLGVQRDRSLDDE